MFKGLFGSRSQRHYARGIEHFNEGRLTDAIACFEEAIASDDDGPDAALARFYHSESHARLGARSLEAGDHRAALKHLDAALTGHDRFPDLHIQRAITLLHLDDPLAAERSARAALELNAGFVDAGAVLVVSLVAQGDSTRAGEAAARWKKAAGAKGDPLAPAFGEPSRLFDALVAARARRAERRAIVERAETSLRDGFWSEAAQLLEPLVAETPGYPDLRLRLAAARLGLGDLEGARAHLDAALERNPDFADAHVLAGIVALRSERVRSARAHFEAAGASGRVPLASMYGRMLCDLRTGEFAKALEGMNRLAGEDAPPEPARVLHAILESRAGRSVTAVERFEAALASARRMPLLVDIAMWATSQGDFAFAARALDAIDEEERTSVEAVRAMAALRAAEGALDRSRQLCESALMDHPHDAGLLMDLASILGRQGAATQGLRCLEQVDGPVPAALRARLFRQAGEVEAARSELESAGRGATDPLELLYICRASDDADTARAIHRECATAGALDLAWRVQDPGRWLGPLRPWPAFTGTVRRDA